MPTNDTSFAVTDTFTANTGGASNIANLFDQTAVPEPGSMLLLGTGLLTGLVAIRRRRQA